ncbi:right-handed parallel beta-helix repeat-containing protein [Rufibacter tibetensis]|uniref:right-handed parallel beta-helix repeat-containing protein n=1 Tax=Rufibacter tibetensis TaxID=512763 RepID=UPI0007867239|nr:right-handed parallel beta-helix repeat-containing protein [Rufibacter tibetensis]
MESYPIQVALNKLKSRLKRLITLSCLFILSNVVACCNDPLSTDGEDPEPKPETPEAAPAKGYYLSREGDDTNPGTREKPWRSLEKLNGVDLEPGETVYLEGGATFPGTLILDLLDSGSKGKAVTITSYGTGPATIDGGAKEAVIIKSSFFRLKGVNARGAGRKEGNTSNGIELQKASDGTLEQVTVEGFQHTGLMLYSCHNVEAVKVVAKNNGFCGIFVTGAYQYKQGRYIFPDIDADCSKNITLRDCLVENNAGDPSVTDNSSGSGILVEMTKGALIDHCVATNNGWDMPRGGNGPVGIWTHSSDSVTIQHCISYRNKTSPNGHDGGGFALDGGVTNSVIQYCLSYENEGAGYGLYQWSGAMDWNNNTVRYSISINDAIEGNKDGIGYGSFTFWNGSGEHKQYRDCFIHNNLIYNNISPITRYIGGNNFNFGIYNNIFIGRGEIIAGSSPGYRFMGNTYWNLTGSSIYFGGYGSLQEWANATGQEKLEGRLLGTYADPLLNGHLTISLTDPYQMGSLSGFKLQPTSPVKDKGLDLQTLFKLKLPVQDFFGNPAFRGIAPEPGIHELE